MTSGWASRFPVGGLAISLLVQSRRLPSGLCTNDLHRQREEDRFRVTKYRSKAQEANHNCRSNGLGGTATNGYKVIALMQA